MSEKGPRIPDHASAEVVDLDAARRVRRMAEYEDPSELTSAEVIDAFFAELEHPSMAQAERTADYIIDMLDNTPVHELDELAAAWREQTRALMVDVDDWDDIDAREESDVPLGAILEVLLDTKEPQQVNEAMRSQRRALRLLRDLRGREIEDNMTSSRGDQRWLALIRRLGTKPE